MGISMKLLLSKSSMAFFADSFDWEQLEIPNVIRDTSSSKNQSLKISESFAI